MRYLILILIPFMSLGQFNYQALVKDSNGELITSETINLRLSIQDVDENVLFSESHILSTTLDGMIHAEIGNGTNVSGTFSSIDWSELLYLKEEIDLGSGYFTLGTSKLLGVPISELSRVSEALTSSATIVRNGVQQEINTLLDQILNDIDLINTSLKVYLDDNGVTIKCPQAPIGRTFSFQGKNYLVVDNDLLRSKVEDYLDGATVDFSCMCTSKVTDMSYLFQHEGVYATNFNQNIRSWDTSNVRDMERMFFNCENFNIDIGIWDVGLVNNFRLMFRRAYSFNQNIGGWNTSSASNMSMMFYEATAFNQDISDWDTYSASDMGGMFRGASVFNQDISDWDTSSVTEMDGMFREASAFNQDISDWDTSSVTFMDGIFNGASVFNQDLSGWCVTNITSEPSDFSTSSSLSTENKPVWGTCPN